MILNLKLINEAIDHLLNNHNPLTAPKRTYPITESIRNPPVESQLKVMEHEVVNAMHVSRNLQHEFAIMK